MLKSGIYAIINIKNGKKYIGQSVEMSVRKTTHFRALKEGKHFNRHLQSSWNKYGADNFEFSIIEKCAPEKLTSREQYFINSEEPENLYNMCLEACDSTLGIKYSGETRAKLSVINKGKNNPNYGKIHSAETRAKMSVMAIGVKNHNYGKTFSAKVIANMSKASTGERNGNSIVTRNDVRSIRENKDNKTVKELVLEFGIKKSQVYNILNNSVWKE